MLFFIAHTRPSILLPNKSLPTYSINASTATSYVSSHLSYTRKLPSHFYPSSPSNHSPKICCKESPQRQTLHVTPLVKTLQRSLDIFSMSPPCPQTVWSPPQQSHLTSLSPLSLSCRTIQVPCHLRTCTCINPLTWHPLYTPLDPHFRTLNKSYILLVSFPDLYYSLF